MTICPYVEPEPQHPARRAPPPPTRRSPQWSQQQQQRPQLQVDANARRAAPVSNAMPLLEKAKALANGARSPDTRRGMTSYSASAGAWPPQQHQQYSGRSPYGQLPRAGYSPGQPGRSPYQQGRSPYQPYARSPLAGGATPLPHTQGRSPQWAAGRTPPHPAPLPRAERAEMPAPPSGAPPTPPRSPAAAPSRPRAEDMWQAPANKPAALTPAAPANTIDMSHAVAEATKIAASLRAQQPASTSSLPTPVSASPSGKVLRPWGPEPVGATVLRSPPSLESLRPSKRQRTASFGAGEADMELDTPEPEPLFTAAPPELDLADLAAGVPTQEELFGAPEDDHDSLFGAPEDDHDSLFDADEVDELDSDEDVKPLSARQNADMESDSSDSDSDGESEADVPLAAARRRRRSFDPADPDPRGPDVPLVPVRRGPRRAPVRTQAKSKKSKKQPASEAIFAGTCLRCPGRPTFGDMYNHLRLSHRRERLSERDFACDRLALCACGALVIRATYKSNHLRFCGLPLAQRLALGLKPADAPKAKGARDKIGGRCNVCAKDVRDLPAHMRSTHRNRYIVPGDFDCDEIKACCGKIWKKTGSRHRCDAGAEHAQPISRTSSGQRSSAAAPMERRRSSNLPATEPRRMPTPTFNIHSQPARSGSSAPPGELPNRLQFATRI